MQVVTTELYGISDVTGLGVNLEIHRYALERIGENYRFRKKGLLRVIYHWLKGIDIVPHRQNKCPTWGALADAVSPISYSLAMRIRNKYCC